ncbi:hypothetical protein Hanom_Chr04g00345261 [Helianthus anomalus]
MINSQLISNSNNSAFFSLENPFMPLDLATSLNSTSFMLLRSLSSITFASSESSTSSAISSMSSSEPSSNPTKASFSTSGSDTVLILTSGVGSASGSFLFNGPGV